MYFIIAPNWRQLQCISDEVKCNEDTENNAKLKLYSIKLQLLLQS